jgi:aldehyde dehydrogenase (NAD+)
MHRSPHIYYDLELQQMTVFQEIVDRQRAYFNTDITKSFAWRVEQLDRLAKMLKENDQHFYDAVSADFKTAPQEKIFEVAAPLGTIELVKAELQSWMQPTEATLPVFLRESGHKGLVYREPFGVALIIGPFNGPLTLLLDPAITALSAGNTCVLKISDSLPATSALLLDLVPRYFEPEAVCAVTGGRDEMQALLKVKFDFIFFTGSTRVGKVVMKAAAEYLTPVLLELGGQNPAIVDQTANIPDAAMKLMWGATAWGGQWCTSPGYACIHESVVEEFIAESRKALVTLYGDDPKGNPDLSKIVTPAAVERLATLIEGTSVVQGGQADPAARYIAPTILYPVSWSDKIMEEEIFGPILPIIPYTDIGDTIRRIKAMPKPLSAFVFSRDQAVIDQVIRSISFGGGAVNQTNIHLFIETMPFGGVGDSGIGHYYGRYGYESLTHAKAMLISPADVAIEHLFPPYNMEKVVALNQWFEF